jgi:FlaA1/EpsC-like NDP-sugar epimerase
MFAADYAARSAEMGERLRGARVLVIGGAGSIGGSVVRLLAEFPTAALHIVDASENSLVELTRDLRSSGAPLNSGDIRWLPLDYGTPVMHRLIAAEAPYDHVLNFAAMKHVRSEKDAYSVLRMLDVNVVQQASLLAALARRNPATRYFSVSTDKAANPVNLMGASKRLMEHVMFADAFASEGSRTSARFANVAFSDGSLLQGWGLRVAKRQPVPAPIDTRRFFVSLEEAGHLCMLAAFCQPHRHVLIPRLAAETDLHLLHEIADRYLRALGYEPVAYRDEREAIARVDTDVARGRYPLLLTPLDTSGEKAYEEFVGEGEAAVDVGLQALEAVRYLPLPASVDLSGFVAGVAELIRCPELPTSKSEIVERMRAVLPELQHVETHRRLDDRV